MSSKLCETAIKVLRQTRKEHGLSMNEIGEMLGCTRQYVAHVLKYNVISAKIAHRVVEVFPDHGSEIIKQAAIELDDVAEKISELDHYDRRVPGRQNSVTMRLSPEVKQWLDKMAVLNNVTIPDMARRCIERMSEAHSVTTLAREEMAERWYNKNIEFIKKCKSKKLLATTAYKSGYLRSTVK